METAPGGSILLFDNRDFSSSNHFQSHKKMALCHSKDRQRNQQEGKDVLSDEAQEILKRAKRNKHRRV